jgi:NAD dependent epimerase/dehydratase family enzyme
MLHAATDRSIRGPVNAVSPEPVTNREFTRQLAKILHRPAIFPVPAIALRIALGEFASVLLSSQRVRPRVATDCGCRFRDPELHGCLEEILVSPTAEK